MPDADPPYTPSGQPAHSTNLGTAEADGVVSGPPGTGRTRKRIPWWLAVIVVIIAGYVAARPVPYYVVAPGTTESVDDFLDVSPADSYPPEGEIYLATVSVREGTVWDLLEGRFQSNWDIIGKKEFTGGLSPKDIKVLSEQEMETSQQLATVIALRRLGYAVPESGTGVEVINVLEESPAAKVFRRGDTIVEVEGKPVTINDHLTPLLATKKVGDKVTLVIEAKNKKRRTAEVEMIASPEDKRPVIGIAVATRDLEYDLPIDIDIADTDIGGPSAGLAFTLGLIDELSPGELTGGKNIAATGTIEPDGKVGDVGGVRQKTIAVQQRGAEVFLVPPGEYQDARAAAGKSLKVVRVSSLEEALDALGREGGDVSALPPAPATLAA